MEQLPSLAQRFVAGSNRIHVTIPEQSAFFIGMPRSVKEVENVSRALLAAHEETFQELQRGFAENAMALNEISGELSSLRFAVSEGFHELSDAVVHLEGTLCAELGEVKWVLGQMDGKLGELVHLVKFPRETEARELVEDGVKALAAGHLDDAEYCLAKAVETKRTSFQGNMNLAFVFLHKDDAEHAIAHFRKAADYAPAAEKDGAKVLALENLARSYFAASNFAAARATIEQALALRAQHEDRSLHSEYQHATYCAQLNDAPTASSTVVSLCQAKSTFFTMAATDSDFEPIRSHLLHELETLAQTTHARALQELSEAEAKCTAVFTQINEQESQAEMSAVRTALTAAREWLGKRTYEESIRARRIVEVVSQLLGELQPAQEARCLAAEQRVALSRGAQAVAEGESALATKRTQLGAAISRTHGVGEDWRDHGFIAGAVVLGLVASELR
jgi:tetratricopeptide (TPR) repeat protein